MHKPLPSVAIIILSWNSAADTAECLRSLASLDYPNYRVLIVDNGSTDGTVATLRNEFPELQIIENKRNAGFAEGNNIGIRAALAQHSDYFFLLNDDTTVQPATISLLMQAGLEYPDVGILCPRITSYFDHSKQYIGAQIAWRYGAVIDIRNSSTIRPAILETDYAPGCALLIKAEVIQKIGLLDPAFFAYFEDVDWSLRCRKAGYRVVVVPEAEIRHKGSMDQSSSKSAFATFLFRRNQILFMRKYARWYHWPSFVKHYSRQSLLRINDAVQNEQPDKAVAIVDGVWAGVTGQYGSVQASAPRWFTRLLINNLGFWLWLTSWLFFIDYQRAKRAHLSAQRTQA